jgi:hypothetical protein
MGRVINMPGRDTTFIAAVSAGLRSLADAHEQLAARLGALTEGGRPMAAVIEYAGVLSDLADDLENGRIGRDELLIFEEATSEMTVAVSMMIRAAAMLQ